MLLKLTTGREQGSEVHQGIPILVFQDADRQNSVTSVDIRQKETRFLQGKKTLGIPWAPRIEAIIAENFEMPVIYMLGIIACSPKSVKELLFL